MESCRDIEQYDVSPQLKLDQCFTDMLQFLNSQLYSRDDPKKSSKIQRIAHFMGVGLAQCKEVERKCRSSQLNSEAPISKEDDDQNVKAGAEYLKSCKHQLQLVQQPQKYHRKLMQLSRWVQSDFFPPAASQALQPRFDANGPDTLVTVRVYKPFRSPQSGPARTHDSVVVSQDILMRGSQLLSQLRDVIACQNDDVQIGDLTALSPTHLIPVKCLCKSAMFSIGDTFYSDEREVTNIKNYGVPITEWLQQQGVHTSQITHKCMENTRIDQLSIRLGFPYVFRHLDECEHLISFTDARLMSPEDPQSIGDYPMLQMAPPDIVYCDACEAYPSDWLVDDPEFCPTKWTHFCTFCFRTFYYSNGQLTSRPVQIYPFPQPKWPQLSSPSSQPTTNCSTHTQPTPEIQLPLYQLAAQTPSIDQPAPEPNQSHFSPTPTSIPFLLRSQTEQILERFSESNIFDQSNIQTPSAFSQFLLDEEMPVFQIPVQDVQFESSIGHHGAFFNLQSL